MAGDKLHWGDELHWLSSKSTMKDDCQQVLILSKNASDKLG